MKIAAVDVGSNSVRLMVMADGKTLYKKLNTTRLGEGLEKSGRISPDAIARTVAAVRAFQSVAEKEGCRAFYAFATAAVRSASNRQEILDAVRNACGVDIDVLSGEEEAKCGLAGAVGGRDGGIIDVGGGSTEVILSRNGVCEYFKSVNVGTVRLYDLAGRDGDKLRAVISKKIEEYGDISANGLKIYAIGGTATTLASVKLALKEYDPERINGTVITAEEIGVLADYILTLSVNDVKDLPGMEPRRADVIGGGCLLLHAVMQNMGIDKITVSEADNLEGYVRLKGV